MIVLLLSLLWRGQREHMDSSAFRFGAHHERLSKMQHMLYRIFLLPHSANESIKQTTTSICNAEVSEYIDAFDAIPFGSIPGGN